VDYSIYIFCRCAKELDNGFKTIQKMLLWQYVHLSQQYMYPYKDLKTVDSSSLNKEETVLKKGSPDQILLQETWKSFAWPGQIISRKSWELCRLWRFILISTKDSTRNIWWRKIIWWDDWWWESLCYRKVPKAMCLRNWRESIGDYIRIDNVFFQV